MLVVVTKEPEAGLTSEPQPGMVGVGVGAGASFLRQLCASSRATRKTKSADVRISSIGGFKIANNVKSNPVKWDFRRFVA
jgi:hypothetical protein